MFDHPEGFARAAALGVANYGQMTAGGWMYIGPQGIVHGTFSTLLIAGQTKLGLAPGEQLAGRLFVSSGLGGMSGAQGKAIKIAGGVGIIAEVDPSRIQTRHEQGWVDEVYTDPKATFNRAQQAQKQGEGLALAFSGNIVDLLEYARQAQITPDLLSDQTSCHVAYEGGYCPQGLSFAERTRLLADDPAAFRQAVDQSLARHFQVIKQLVDQGCYFFDYGNAFMKAVFDAGVKDIARNGSDERDGFIWPSYVEDLLGPELFDYGYGPFRWVCLSGKPEDLAKTDQAAAEVIANLRPQLRYQDEANLKWVRDAQQNNLVVGTQARILYQDETGRRLIAKQFNRMVRDGVVGPIMLGRDHHDTGGTDSPYRETANIKDGSNVMADMATQIFAGNAARGMTLIALHNGGGVGIGKAINGGFGLLLDGSEECDDKIERAISWDVMGGVARRAWAGNPHAIQAATDYQAEGRGYITMPALAKDDIIDAAVQKVMPQSDG
jgi:urocanate hydratase